MKRKLSLMVVILASVSLLKAQSPDAMTVRQNDSLILANMIMPVVNSGATPDWDALAGDVKAKYGDSYVDRTVTKAKIYYYYGKDWSVFSKALVHYTEAFEDKDNFKLMNKNAKMVLQYSKDPEEWKAAAVWVKRAVDKEPGNAGYKETYDALTTKIMGQLLTGGQ